jgi:hypothetical protein
MARIDLDAYMTPPHYVGALLATVSIFGRVYEPCVGDGAIAGPLSKLPSVRSVRANDIDKRLVGCTHNDAREPFLFDEMFDWVITNPPFSDELPILENAIDAAPNVAFLARLSFLEPTEDREYFLNTHPPTQVIVLPRHSFRKNDKGEKATDSVTCAWLVWHQDGVPRRTAFFSRAQARAAAVLTGVSE